MPIFLHQIKSSEIHKYLMGQIELQTGEFGNPMVPWPRSDGDKRTDGYQRFQSCFHDKNQVELLSVLYYSIDMIFIIKSCIVHHHHNPVDMTMSEGGSWQLGSETQHREETRSRRREAVEAGWGEQGGCCCHCTLLYCTVFSG